MKTQSKILETQALEKLKRLCSRKEKCKADIRQKLIGWHIAEETANKIILQLESENFIDEKRFAMAFSGDKIKFNKWGKLKVRYQLTIKGISDTDISNALSEINEEEYIEMIRKEIRAKYLNIKAKSDWERKLKIMQFAQSRGYETDIVNEILEQG